MAEDANQKPKGPAGAPGKPMLVPAPGSHEPVPAPAGQPPAVSDEKAKVVHIVRRLQDAVTLSEDSRKKRKPAGLLAVLACVALPTLIAFVYFFAIAADRYASEARFAVRSNDRQAVDALGMFAGMPSSEAVSDSYIVADYIGSLEMLSKLEERLPLRQMYRDESADFFSRLGSAASQERFLKYWQNSIYVFFDSTKQTVTVEVQAFQPDHAERITAEVIDIVHNLVNELSAQARRDAIQSAASELARAELNVRAARDAMFQFRVDNNQVDPSATAEATLEIIAELEAERTQLTLQMATVSGYLSEESPSVRILLSRINALDAEIERIRRQISEPSTPAGGATAGSQPFAVTIGEYQELLVDLEFAEKAYTAALASLDRARADADRTQTYLAVFANPIAAEEAAYPRRWMNVLIVLVVSSVLWAIGSLGFLAVRDHVG